MIKGPFRGPLAFGGQGRNRTTDTRIFSRVTDRVRLDISMSYRGACCPICMTMQDDAQLVHANFTQCILRVMRPNQGRAVTSGHADLGLEEKCARLEGRPDGWGTSAADAELSDRAGRQSAVLRQDLALLQFNAEQLTKLSPVIARKSAKVRDRRAFRIGVFQSSLHGQQAAHANDHGWAGACD